MEAMKECRVIWALVLGLMVAGCAATNSAEDGHVTVSDPFENVNRFFFDLNQRLDRNAGRPAATAYRDTVPGSVRVGLHNVLDNLGGPVTVANNLLQVRLESAGIATGRFLVNTTVGVAGIFDVASDWGMPARNRDFGETMGTYGVPPGPYLVLPFRGSTDVRDFAGNYLDGYATPLRYVRYEGRNYVGLMKSTLGSINNRANNLVTYRDIERASVDYYATMRTWYLERRARLIEDTPVRTAELPDF
ncbi:MAG TPA: VacJ family lipoprotein [Rhizomicrobium sp.]|nr:VacJ family lipoprotein [Rhizomicrobium sp.]